MLLLFRDAALEGICWLEADSLFEHLKESFEGKIGEKNVFMRLK